MVGELSFADALTEISHALAGTVDTAAVRGICQQRMREKAAAFARTDDQVMTLITELARRDVRLGVISNGFKEDGGKLASSFTRSRLETKGVPRRGSEVLGWPL